MSSSASDAAEALAALKASRARLAVAADCSPQRHFVFAAVLGGFVTLPVFPTGIALGLEAVLLGIVFLIARSDRRRTGMFVNGYRRGRTLPLTLTVLAFYLALLALGRTLSRDTPLWWAPLGLALLSLPVGYVASIRWQRIFRREMGAGA